MNMHVFSTIYYTYIKYFYLGKFALVFVHYAAATGYTQKLLYCMSSYESNQHLVVQFLQSHVMLILSTELSESLYIIFPYI